MLITPDYVTEQRRLHVMGTGAYGTRGFNWAYTIVGIMSVEGCTSLLDYGCGKGSMARAVRNVHGITMQSYDPGVPEFNKMPKRADLVASVDVLEHIEPECLNEVISHIRSLTRKLLFVAISTRPAKRFLSDGRNSHLIIENGDWWRTRFERYEFKIRRVWGTDLPEWVALMSVS
jgi:hypothetical protein